MGYRLCTFGAFAAVLATACAAAVQTPPADDVSPPASCESAYNALVRLRCPEASGPRTMSWLEFCRVAEQSEGAIWINVACISRASRVEDVRECRVQCRK